MTDERVNKNEKILRIIHFRVDNVNDCEVFGELSASLASMLADKDCLLFPNRRLITCKVVGKSDKLYVFKLHNSHRRMKRRIKSRGRTGQSRDME